VDRPAFAAREAGPGPVSLFLVPRAVAAALVLFPLEMRVRAAGLLLGAAAWGVACVRAWEWYRTWIRAGAVQPWFRQP
jgi:hypothetical protein